MLTFSHADSVNDGVSEIVDITERINEAIRLVQLSPDTKGLAFEVAMPSDAKVIGDANLLMQVFVNLINNACDASPKNGRVTIRGKIKHQELIVETIDQGPGIQGLAREHLFEPFFTTKPVGQGTGLGLSLAYSIVTNHNGKLRLGNTESGTSMVVSLPLYSEETT